jgi:tetratricopeptide (TPR) repeat protein
MNSNMASIVRPARLGVILCGLMILGWHARAGGDGPPVAEVGFSAVDVRGSAVNVPQAGQTTVVLFLLAGQPQGAQAIASLEPVVAKTADTRVVTVVGGSEAAGQIRILLADKHPWPIVLDAEHVLSGRLSVHAWPTTVVISGDGARVGHLAGQPKAYASNLEAYLEFAAGRIDQAGLDRRLANHEAVADTPEQIAERHVQVASRLLQKGLIEQSRGELARALALHPKDLAVQVDLADLLLRAGDVSGAGTVLEQMDAQASTARVKVLRGKFLIASGKWDEARELLTSAVQLNPEPAEGLYQLGLVYQHDADWPRAAEAFRKAFEHTPSGRQDVAAVAAPVGK